jgi:hypothetical protein
MPLLNDDWFYEKLDRFKPALDLDMKDWFKINDGPRWRGMNETIWDTEHTESIYSRFASKLPKQMADEMLYLLNRLLDITRKIHPCFETIMLNNAYAEGLLYANLDNEKYRDHIIHPFKVAVLARWLLEESEKLEEIKNHLKENEKIKEVLSFLNLPKAVFDEDNDKIIKCALWLAGFFHDIGYFHSLFHKVEERVKQLYPFYKGDVAGTSVAGIDPHIMKRSLIRHYLISKDKYGKEILDSWRHGIYSNLHKNHSVAGAIAFLHFFQEILDHWHDVDPRMLLTFELAAEAILLHDLTEKKRFTGELKISFSKQPLSIILILADELQDWGRPKIRYRNSNFIDQVVMDFKSINFLEYELDNTQNPVILKIPKANPAEDEKVYDKIIKLDVFEELNKFIQIESLQST